MKRKVIIAVIAVVLVAAALVFNRPGQPQRGVQESARDRTPRAVTEAVVPAHYETAPEKASLAPSLPPEKFTGKTREAYRAVREMPEIIAQMPCYCHCDKGFGHKSLQSCFVDDHAAHCAVCVNEALAAFKLRKEQALAAPQIRERIIAEYSDL